MTTKIKTAPAAEEKATEPEQMVEFTDAQHFEVRTITPQDWAKAGVEDGQLVHWHRGNNFRLPRSTFDFLSKTQFDQYILGDPRLVLVTETAETEQ